MTLPRMYLPQELAEAAHMNIETVYRRIKRGEIQAINKGTARCHRYLITEREAKRFLGIT